jgi:hypothetical protein
MLQAARVCTDGLDRARPPKQTNKIMILIIIKIIISEKRKTTAGGINKSKDRKLPYGRAWRQKPLQPRDATVSTKKQVNKQLKH